MGFVERRSIEHNETYNACIYDMIIHMYQNTLKTIDRLVWIHVFVIKELRLHHNLLTPLLARPLFDAVVTGTTALCLKAHGWGPQCWEMLRYIGLPWLCSSTGLEELVPHKSDFQFTILTLWLWDDDIIRTGSPQMPGSNIIPTKLWIATPKTKCLLLWQILVLSPKVRLDQSITVLLPFWHPSSSGSRSYWTL